MFCIALLKQSNILKVIGAVLFRIGNKYFVLYEDNQQLLLVLNHDLLSNL